VRVYLRGKASRTAPSKGRQQEEGRRGFKKTIVIINRARRRDEGMHLRAPPCDNDDHVVQGAWESIG
jgi:hypothetical protein